MCKFVATAFYSHYSDIILQDLIQDIREHGLPTGETIDWMWLHEVGSGCDDTELPHHLSTPEEIQELLKKVKHCLRQIRKPDIATVARYQKIIISLSFYLASPRVMQWENIKRNFPLLLIHPKRTFL
jgi:hypothetical protein